MGQMLPGGQILTSQSQTLAKKRWDNVSFRIKGLRPKGMRPNWQRPNALQSKRSQSKARRDKACPGPKNHKPKSQSPKFQRSKWPKSKQSQPKNRQSQARSSPKRRVQKGHGTKSWQDKVRFSPRRPRCLFNHIASLKYGGKSVKNLTISYRCKIYRFDKSTCENSNLSVKVKFHEVRCWLWRNSLKICPRSKKKTKKKTSLYSTKIWPTPDHLQS